MKLPDLVRHDDPASSAEYLDVAAAISSQQVDHVLEIFDVPALVARDGDALHVLLQSRIDDFSDRAVVPQVDDLDPTGLQNPPHDIDRGIVPVEKRGRGDEADLLLRRVRLQLLAFGEVGHRSSSWRARTW